ncbi:MAG: hypothetical protein JXA44_10925 [Methanospirillaceae archaeon]|nr:hypothetical protein [Methanospirillaceae archaeon]
MTYIKTEMMGFKTAIDTIIANEKVNSPIASTFELSTQPGSAEGAFSILPLSSFVSSSGSLQVNQRKDTLTIRVGGYYENYNQMVNTNYKFEDLFTGTRAYLNLTPKHLLVNYTVNDLDNPTTFRISAHNWTADINVKPRYLLNTSEFLLGQNPVWTETQYDLIINVSKNLTPFNSNAFFPTITNLIIKENIKEAGNPLCSDPECNTTIDLYDGAYGIVDDLKITDDVVFTLGSESESFYLSHLRTPSYQEPEPIPTIKKTPPPQPHDIGSFEFISDNRYWIEQNYLYEMGALFLWQDEGKTVIMAPPIGLTVDTEGKFYAKITDIQISDAEEVGGTRSVQTFAKIEKLTKNEISGEKLTDGLNAQYVWITYEPDIADPETVEMWSKAFDWIYYLATKSDENTKNWARTVNESTKIHFIIGKNANAFSEPLTITNMEDYFKDDFYLDYVNTSMSIVMQR